VLGGAAKKIRIRPNDFERIQKKLILCPIFINEGVALLQPLLLFYCPFKGI